MQIAIKDRDDPDAAIAEEVLRSCVHCGFCNATCPTFQLKGVELEGPRGRLYLIKGLLEGRIGHSRKVVNHLDNCLACLSCETTCPSGVRYGRLLDSARGRITELKSRRPAARLQRALLAAVLPHPGRLRQALRLGRLAKPVGFLLPERWGSMLEAAPLRLPRPSVLTRRSPHAPEGRPGRAVALLTGCVQEVLAPRINDASIRLLTRLGCEVHLPEGQKCCGALVHHMGDRARSLPMMKNNIDAWHAAVEREGLEHIVINASGCGAVVKEYGHILRNDPDYSEKAARVSSLTLDISEMIHLLGLPGGGPSPAHGLRVAYQDACSLLHGQGISVEPRELLRKCGFEVLDIPSAHLCCGSAGAYSMLKPRNAKKLGRLKAQAIASAKPQLIATGNVGCMVQLSANTGLPVLHTAELLDWATGGPKPRALG